MIIDPNAAQLSTIELLSPAPPSIPPISFADSIPDAADLGAAAGSRAVFFPDDRVRIPQSASSAYPLRTLMHLMIQYEGNEPPAQRQATGTGWLASKRTVVTAAHCLLTYRLNPGPRRAEFIRVVPSSNQLGQPSQYIDVPYPELQLSQRWRNPPPGGLPDDAGDYGAFDLPVDAGSTLQWMQLVVLKDPDIKGLPTAIVGYPNEPNKPLGTMWGQGGKLLDARPDFVYYDIDTSGGQSGSPVYTMHKGIAYVVALHESRDISLNRGVRINPTVFNEIAAWLS